MSTGSIGTSHVQSPPLAGAAGGLRRNYLSMTEVIAQAVGVIAPSVMPALALPSEYESAGYGSWLGYLVATIAVVFVALNINEFSKREASPGSLYVVAAKGLGPIWGVISGWALLLGYLFTGAAVISGAANYFLILFHLPDIANGGQAAFAVLSCLVVAIAWYLAFRDIKLSSKTTLIIECLTMTLIVCIVVAALLSRGHVVDRQQIALEGFSFNSVRLGLVLAVFSFVGFEAATVVGTETKDPFRIVPRAVLLSVIVSGIFFIVVAYAIVSAFHDLTPVLNKSDAPLNQLATSIGAGWLGDIVSLGVAISCFACTLACINAAARVLYALSRHGLVHSATGRTHHQYATPHTAVTMAAVIALVVSLSLTVFKVGGVDAFGYFGTIASFGFSVVYLLVSIGTPLYLKRAGALRTRHVVVSAVSVVLLLVCVEGSLYPIPDWPMSLMPYIFVALALAGLGYCWLLRARAPQELASLEADLMAPEKV